MAEGRGNKEGKGDEEGEVKDRRLEIISKYVVKTMGLKLEKWQKCYNNELYKVKLLKNMYVYEILSQKLFFYFQ